MKGNPTKKSGKETEEIIFIFYPYTMFNKFGWDQWGFQKFGWDQQGWFKKKKRFWKTFKKLGKKFKKNFKKGGKSRFYGKSNPMKGNVNFSYMNKG
jgi:hypothetical protein